MNDENGQDIGPLLRFERVRSGVSQAKISRDSGLTQSTVSRLESGDSNFRIATLERYVSALGKKLNLISKDAELFHYTAQVQSVYDGDTCAVSTRQRCRQSVSVNGPNTLSNKG